MDDLAKLNEQLVERRKQLGLDAEGRGAILATPLPTPGIRASARSAAPTIGEALGSLPKPGRYQCSAKLQSGERCSATTTFPGRCPDCYAAVEAEEQAARVRTRLKRIPGEYRQATWDALEAGLLSRAGGTRVRCDLRRLRRIREALSSLSAGGRAVLHGIHGSGKSSIAAAWLREQIECGVESAWWVAADDLGLDTVRDDSDGGPIPRDLARRGEVVVLDDLGGETSGALLNTGLMAQRVDAAVKVIAARHARNAGRIVITSNYNETELSAMYTPRIARRVFEGAVVIDLSEST